ncbi:2Fe-2S iron-sulfur cluster-binding protein [Bradyrhizobium tropiciagri]|uniref:2Fe-2S iron-sulfur cluster-binding protein n=1 Tax=Bradyrhizobium tropiciagri TaxID=312253 RepID=UPI0032DFF6F0
MPQCGICQFGMMIKVTELLEHNAKPSDADIKAAGSSRPGRQNGLPTSDRTVRS